MAKRITIDIERSFGGGQLVRYLVQDTSEENAEFYVIETGWATMVEETEIDAITAVLQQLPCFAVQGQQKMSDRHKSLERLEARIDEMVSAIDWCRKESARLEQEAFKAGFQYGERHGKGLPGAWFTDYEHTYLRWKHHLNGPKPDETPEINHDNGSMQAWESTARGAASDVIAMAKTLREIAKRCEDEQDSGYGYIHGLATAALQIAGDPP